MKETINSTFPLCVNIDPHLLYVYVYCNHRSPPALEDQGKKMLYICSFALCL